MLLIYFGSLFQAQKEIKRLSSTFEEQLQDQIVESERLTADKRRLGQELERLEQDKAKAREERQRLRKEREKEQAWANVEKSRQLEEWSQINEEKRLIAIARQRDQETIKKQKVSCSL